MQDLILSPHIPYVVHYIVTISRQSDNQISYIGHFFFIQVFTLVLFTGTRFLSRLKSSSVKPVYLTEQFYLCIPSPTYLCAYLPSCLPVVYLICITFWLSTYHSARLFDWPPVRLPASPPVCPPFFLPACLSSCLSACLSLHVCIVGLCDQMNAKTLFCFYCDFIFSCS